MRAMLYSVCVAILVLQTAWGRDRKDPEAVVAKMIKAYGGEDKLASVKAVTMKSKTTRSDGKVLINEMIFQLPGEHVRRVSTEQGEEKKQVIEVLNEEESFVQVDGKTRSMSKDERAIFESRLHRMMVTTLPSLLKNNKDMQVTPFHDAKVDGRNAAGLRVTGKHFGEFHLFIDPDSGRLLKTEIELRMGQNKGELHEAFYEGFKDVGGGLQRATTIRSVVDGKPSRTSEVLSYEFHTEKMPAKLFTKP